ncbi:MAG: hypothetical protein JWR54_2278 [Mucilaginibacter sp.]|nr:hypothetical protein [Mucilaginibacter sp.]
MKIKYPFTCCLLIVISVASYSTSVAQTIKFNNGTKKLSAIHISGDLVNSDNVVDTVTIRILGEFGSGNLYRTADSSVSVITAAHHFNFNFFPKTKPTYISIQIGSPDWQGAEEILTQELINPDDSINFIYDCKTKNIHFSGKGSEKFNWYKSMELSDVRLRDSLPKFIFDTQPAKWICNDNFRLNYHLQSLQLLKGRIDDTTYSILKADLIAQNQFYIYDLMRAWDFGIGYQRPQLDSVYKIDFYEKSLDTSSSDLLAKSGCYAIYMVNKFNTDNAYRELHHFPNEKDVYHIIKDNYVADLRDKMLLTFLFKKYAFQELSDTLLSDAILTIENKDYVEVLKSLQCKIGKGQPIVAFAFNDKNGNKFDLNKFKNKVIFIDMWFTGCGGCIAVSKALPNVEEAFKGNLNVAFVSLSIDKSRQTWLRSINPDIHHPGIHYTTLTSIYLYTNGTGNNNEFIRRYNATSGYPRLILIGKNGKIYSFNPPRPDAPGGSEKLILLIKQALQE